MPCLRAVFYCITLCIWSASDGSELIMIGITGESVTLPCRYDFKYHGPTEVCWGRAEVPTFKCSNTIVITDGVNVTFRESFRYRLWRGKDRGDVSLTIVDLTENDSGHYGCRVEISGLFNDLKRNFRLIAIKGEQQSTTPLILTQPTVLLSDGQQENEISTEVIRTQGEWTTRPAGTDGSDVLVQRQAQAQESAFQMNGNAIRIGAVIFIPGLILVIILELWSRQKKKQINNVESDHSAPAGQAGN